MLRRAWIVASCALAACGGARQQQDREPAPRAAASNPSPAAEAPPAEAPPATEATCRDLSALAAAAEAQPVIDGLFYWCFQFRESIQVLTSCDAVPPEAKDSFNAAWEGLITAHRAASTPEAEEAVRQACRSTVEKLCPASVEAGCGVLPPRR